MFYFHSLLFSICVDQTEPFSYSRKQFDGCSERLEIFAAKLDSCLACFVEHELHVAENIAGILPERNLVAFLPELLRLLSDGLDKAEFLHVTGRQCAVEIVNQCYNGALSHDKTNF